MKHNAGKRNLNIRHNQSQNAQGAAHKCHFLSLSLSYFACKICKVILDGLPSSCGGREWIFCFIGSNKGLRRCLGIKESTTKYTLLEKGALQLILRAIIWFQKSPESHNLHNQYEFVWTGCFSWFVLMLSRKWMCWKKSGQVWSCPISRIRTLIEFCALVFVSTSHTDYTGSRPKNLLSNKTKDCIRIWRLWAPPTALLADSPTTQLVFQLHYCHSCLDFYSSPFRQM